ncbi:PKD domain containing protein [Natrinema thermotolerans DSM 11552]|nr:PKD domain containing protein [Natrinema thermotolerans DSM 11552]
MVTSGLTVGCATAQDGGPPAPPHSVYGDVVDSNGDPVENALVEVTDGGGTVLANDTTDENGAYSIKVDEPDEGDEFTVTVSGVENTDEKVLTWTSGESERIDLSVERAAGGGGLGGLPAQSDDDGGLDNPEPTAVISVDPGSPTVGEEITFSAAESTDKEREIIAYEWEIDGDTYTGETVTTSFAEPGTYDIELTVRNDFSETDTATETVTVAESNPGSSDGGNTTETDGSDANETDGGDSSSIPGFGVTITLLSLLAFAMLALRRQR